VQCLFHIPRLRGYCEKKKNYWHQGEHAAGQIALQLPGVEGQEAARQHAHASQLALEFDALITELGVDSGDTPAGEWAPNAIIVDPDSVR
jgi:hypothetical protein